MRESAASASHFQVTEAAPQDAAVADQAVEREGGMLSRDRGRDFGRLRRAASRSASARRLGRHFREVDIRGLQEACRHEIDSAVVAGTMDARRSLSSNLRAQNPRKRVSTLLIKLRGY
jgi:hypothetical protein